MYASAHQQQNVRDRRQTSSDRQTDVRRASSLNAPSWGGYNNVRLAIVDTKHAKDGFRCQTSTYFIILSHAVIASRLPVPLLLQLRQISNMDVSVDVGR